MTKKIDVYLYSFEDTKKSGAYLITLKNGKQFYATSIIDADNYDNSALSSKDNIKIYTCSKSQVLTNEPNERAKKIFEAKKSGINELPFSETDNDNYRKEAFITYVFHNNNNPNGIRPVEAIDDFTSPRELLARSIKPLHIISHKSLYNESEFQTFDPKIMLGLRDGFKAPENPNPNPKPK